ncbi:MAG: WbqC family protein [bacterium]|nr:WbqC family protein [bacterium]
MSAARPRTVAMAQSNYIPWKGYFDMIRRADLFVFYDDVQFTKEDWRNRNKIKTAVGTQWLTIPCGKSPNRRICDVEIESSYWQSKHWRTIEYNYTRAPHFAEYRELFEELYVATRWTSLIDVNRAFIERISREVLGIDTPFGDSRDYDLPDERRKEERWLRLLEILGAERFIIGPTARNYIDAEKEARIARDGIELLWMDYGAYAEYPQLFPPFEHKVSIIDLVFNVGPAAARYLGPGDGS